MNKVISLVLLLGGVILLIFGINATNAFDSDVSRFFTGFPTDKAIWMLMGGIIASLHGEGQVFQAMKKGEAFAGNPCIRETRLIPSPGM